MAIKGITLKESMNRSVQAIMPLDEEKEVFNQKLVSYLTHLKDKEDESEEYQKNLLKGFLESVLPYNFINTSSRIDLVIYNGKDANSSLGILFECNSTHVSVNGDLINSQIGGQNNALNIMIGYIIISFIYYIINSGDMKYYSLAASALAGAFFLNGYILVLNGNGFPV